MNINIAGIDYTLESIQADVRAWVAKSGSWENTLGFTAATVQSLIYKIEEQQRVIDAMETRNLNKSDNYGLQLSEEELSEFDEEDLDDDYDLYPGNEAGAFDALDEELDQFDEQTLRLIRG